MKDFVGQHFIKCNKTQNGSHIIKCQPKKRGRKTKNAIEEPEKIDIPSLTKFKSLKSSKNTISRNSQIDKNELINSNQDFEPRRFSKISDIFASRKGEHRNSQTGSRRSLQNIKSIVTSDQQRRQSQRIVNFQETPQILKEPNQVSISSYSFDSLSHRMSIF